MRIKQKEFSPALSAPGLRLFVAKSGALTAQVALESGKIRHLHSVIAPETEADYFRDLKLWGDVILCVGIGLGYHLAHALQRLPAGARIVLIDRYPELISRACKVLLAGCVNPILTICAGDNAQIRQQLEAFLAPMRGASVQIIRHPASYSLHPQWYDAMLDTACGMLKKNASVHRLPARPLLMLGGFFLESGMRRGFQNALGNDPAILHYKEIDSLPFFESRLQRELQNGNIDFLLSINMLGFDSAGMISDTTRRLGIPVVVWFVDDPRPILLQQQPFVKDHFIGLTWERAYLPALRSAGFGAAAYLPLAADPFAGVANEVQEAAISISFAGTSMGGRFLENIRRKFLWRDSLQPLTDEASAIIASDPSIPVENALRECSQRLGCTIPFSDWRNMTWLHALIIHTASMKKRQRMLRPLVAEGLETFGDEEGWRELLGPQVRTHPPVDAQEGLFRVYRRTEVSVNVTSCQMPTAVNLRVFEAPLAGGFLLSDNQSDLGELFVLGKEAISYETPDELRDKARYYRTHAQERAKISQAGRARVLAEHTCSHRAHAIIHAVFNHTS